MTGHSGAEKTQSQDRKSSVKTRHSGAEKIQCQEKSSDVKTWQSGAEKIQCQDRAERRREDPVTEHRHRESERHAERGHDQVGGGQVDEEPAEVGARPASGSEDDNGEDVADDRQRRGGTVQDDEHRLIALRKTQRHRRAAAIHWPFTTTSITSGQF